MRFEVMSNHDAMKLLPGADLPENGRRECRIVKKITCLYLFSSRGGGPS